MVYEQGIGVGLIGLDWTFGTAYLDGKPWLTGVPFPIADVTSIDAPNKDSYAVDATYIVTGGRGLPSRLLQIPRPRVISSAFDEYQRARKWRFPVAWPEVEQRSAEQILTAGERDELRTKPVGEPDWVSARIALERLPADAIRKTVLAIDLARPDRSLTGLLALARQGTKADLQPILAALGAFAWTPMTHRQRIAWLRVHALALLRQGPANAAQKLSLIHI